LFDSLAEEERSFLADFVRESLDLDDRPGAVWIRSFQEGHKQVDSSDKYHVGDRRGRLLAFLDVANASYPDSVACQVQAAQSAAGRAGAKLGAAILTPLKTGSVQGKSCSIYMNLTGLRPSRPARFVARLALAPRVLDWIVGIAAETGQSFGPAEIGKHVVAPLEWMAESDSFSKIQRTEAEGALSALARGNWIPRFVLSHNDLWPGNVMVQARIGRFAASFGLGSLKVIDWGSSSSVGIPSFDLIYYAETAGISDGLARAKLEKIWKSAGTDPRSCYYDLVAGLGRLGMNRNNFPLDNYLVTVEKCEDIYRRLAGADMESGSAGAPSVAARENVTRLPAQRT